jgi:uncharacterized delta-60 repeat protein
MPRSVRFVLAAVLAVGAFVPLAPGSRAAATGDGWLDPSFGFSGSVRVPRLSGGTDRRVDATVAVGPTGRAFVLVSRLLTTGTLRIELSGFTASGRLDPAFHGGRPILVLDSGGDDPDCCAVFPPFPTADGGVEVPVSFAFGHVFFRYNANGTKRWSAGGSDFIRGVTTLAGGSIRTLTTNIVDEVVSPIPVKLEGTTPSGTIDTKVGPGGTRVLAQMPPAGIVRDSLNRLYVVGSQYAGADWSSPRSLDIRRLSSSGAQDTTYGTGGVTTVAIEQDDTTPDASYVAKLALAPDGSLYMAGHHTNDVTGRSEGIIRKLAPDGTFDVGFGTAGVLAVPAPSGSSRLAALIVDGAGRPIVSFVDRNGKTLTSYLARLDPATGALDPTFGSGGRVAVAGLATGLDTTSTDKLLTVSRRYVNGVWTIYLSRRFN